MTRSQPVFALPALALSLIAAGLFTACGSKPAAEVAAAPPAVLPAAAPEQVVADLYAALNTLRPSGAPTDTQRLILAPLLSAELTGLLQRADAARTAACEVNSASVRPRAARVASAIVSCSARS